MPLEDEDIVARTDARSQGAWNSFQTWMKSDGELVVIHRAFAVMSGDIASASLLAQVVYWHLPDSQGKTRLRVVKNGQPWLAANSQQLQNQCFITDEQVKRGLNVLEELGLIETRLFGFDGKPTRHIRLIHAPFLMQWEHALKFLAEWTSYEAECKAARREKRTAPEKPVYEKPASHLRESPKCDIHGKAANTFGGITQIHLGERPKSNTETSAQTTTEIINTPPGHFVPPPLRGRANITQPSKQKTSDEQRADDISETGERAFKLFSDIRKGKTGTSLRKRRETIETLGVVLWNLNRDEDLFIQAIRRFMATDDRDIIVDKFDIRYFTDDPELWLAPAEAEVMDDPVAERVEDAADAPPDDEDGVFYDEDGTCYGPDGVKQPVSPVKLKWAEDAFVGLLRKAPGRTADEFETWQAVQRDFSDVLADAALARLQETETILLTPGENPDYGSTLVLLRDELRQPPDDDPFGDD